MQNNRKEQRRKLSGLLDKNVSKYTAFNLPEHDMNSLVSSCQKSGRTALRFKNTLNR